MYSIMRPFAVVSLIFSAQLVSALGDFPTCMSGFDWTFNHLNQSPCEVAAALGEACTGSDFPIPALTPDQNYLGPIPASANNCRCSSVFYSVLSACAVCQEAEVLNWSFYAQNCSTVSISVFLPPIPTGFAVPNYAYVDPTANGIDTFNPKSASAAATGPDSTAAPQATGTSSPSATSTPTKKKSTNVGAIAGGVVGGVVAILIVVGLVIFLRRRKSKAQPAQFNSDRLMSENNSAGPNTPMISGATAPTKYYDPNDPTTFPDNYVPSLYTGQSPAAHSQTFPTGAATNYTGTTNTSGLPHQNVHQQPGGQVGYTGMAEVM